MIKARSPEGILESYFEFFGKVIADIGCGTGEFVRWLAKRGARVVGVDTAAMAGRAERYPRVGGETYRVGSAQDMEFEDGSFDLLTYVASFHHVPAREMTRALGKCHRFLKPGGAAVFIEPLGKKGSYYEIVRLIEDERDIQAKAYKAITGMVSLGFSMTEEKIYYVERSLADYAVLLDLFVDDPDRRTRVLAAAKSVTERLAGDSGKSLASYRYQSMCRLNILRKMESGHS